MRISGDRGTIQHRAYCRIRIIESQSENTYPRYSTALMEHIIQLHIEKLPEGVYLATSDDVQGLVAQGRTVQETIERARRCKEIDRGGEQCPLS